MGLNLHGDPLNFEEPRAVYRGVQRTGESIVKQLEGDEKRCSRYKKRESVSRLRQALLLWYVVALLRSDDGRAGVWDSNATMYLS